MDLVNLKPRQKLRVMQEVELAKHQWLDRIYREILPADLYRAAYSPLATADDVRKVQAWLKDGGYVMMDCWGAENLGAVLKRNGKVIERLKVQLESKAFLKSEGNRDIRGNNGKG